MVKLDDPDLAVTRVLLEHEEIDVQVPIGDQLVNWTLEDHLTSQIPYLEQEGETVIRRSNVLIYDLEKYRAVVVLRVEVAAGDDTIELV